MEEKMERPKRMRDTGEVTRINTLDFVKNRIKLLYEKHPDIHVNVTLRRPRKMIMNDLPVRITGVYPNIFQVEYVDKGISKHYMHQYTDVVTRDVEILELSYTVSQNI